MGTESHGAGRERTEGTITMLVSVSPENDPAFITYINNSWIPVQSNISVGNRGTLGLCSLEEREPDLPWTGSCSEGLEGEICGSFSVSKT